MKTILVIEDDRRLASLLQSGIEEAGFQVLLAYDAEMALRLLATHSDAVSLIVSDIILPGMNGLELCRRIRASQSGTPILMLTALGTTDDKLDGFDAGADDYMTKPFDFRELLARISVLLKRGERIESTTETISHLECEDLVLDLDRHECQRAGTTIHLTPKEFTLLEYLMRNAGKVLSRVDIQENVWHTHYDTGTNFIDVYINYLRRKIDRDFPVKLIHTKPGVGFILSNHE